MWEWLTALALTFWIGMVMMEGLLFLSARANGEDPGDGVLAALRKQGKPLQWLCLAAVLVGEIINLLLRGALLTQANLQNGIDLAKIRQLLFASSYGQLWLARIGLVCIALGFLWWTTREQSRGQSGRFSTMARASKSTSRLGQLRMQVMEEQKKEENQDQGEIGSHAEQVKLTPAAIAALPTTPVPPGPMPPRTPPRPTLPP